MFVSGSVSDSSSGCNTIQDQCSRTKQNIHTRFQSNSNLISCHRNANCGLWFYASEKKKKIEKSQSTSSDAWLRGEKQQQQRQKLIRRCDHLLQFVSRPCSTTIIHSICSEWNKHTVFIYNIVLRIFLLWFFICNYFVDKFISSSIKCIWQMYMLYAPVFYGHHACAKCPAQIAGCAIASSQMHR